MPPLALAPAATSQVVRPELNFVVLFKEKKFSEAIARTRIAAIANSLVLALSDLDPDGEYTTIVSRGKQFDYCLVDLRMQPNMIVAETIGRTEAVILYQQMVRIDPANMTRYKITRANGLEIQGH